MDHTPKAQYDSFFFDFANHFVCEYIAKFVRHQIVEQIPWVLKYSYEDTYTTSYPEFKWLYNVYSNW